MYLVHDNNIFITIVNRESNVICYYSKQYEKSNPHYVKQIRQQYAICQSFLYERKYYTNRVTRLFIRKNVYIDILKKNGTYYETLASKYRNLLNFYFFGNPENKVDIGNMIRDISDYIDNIIRVSYTENDIHDLCKITLCEHNNTYELFNHTCTQNISLINDAATSIAKKYEGINSFCYIIKGGTSIIINISKINRLVQSYNINKKDPINIVTCIVPTGDIDLSPMIMYDSEEFYHSLYNQEAQGTNQDFRNELLKLLTSNNKDENVSYGLIEQNENLYTIEINIGTNKYSIIDIGVPDENDEDSIFINTVKLYYGKLITFMNLIAGNGPKLQTTSLCFEYLSSYFGIKLYRRYHSDSLKIKKMIEQKREQLHEIKIAEKEGKRSSKRRRVESSEVSENPGNIGNFEIIMTPENVESIENFIKMFSKQASDEYINKIITKINRYDAKMNNIYESIILLELIGSFETQMNLFGGKLFDENYYKYIKYKTKYLSLKK